MPLHLRKVNGNYVTESYPMMSVLLWEIHGKYLTESYPNDAIIFEGNKW